MMDFETAKLSFVNMVSDLRDSDRLLFHRWIKDYLSTSADHVLDTEVAEAKMQLQKIAGELRTRVPFEGIVPTETILHPSQGADSDLSSKNCFHLDSFLYGREEEERLVSEGLLCRSYCEDCGSKNIRDLTLITHSCSQERLEQIFRKLLPPLDDKTILDVGSRLGAVLYGAFYLSKAKRIIGVEMNAELCQLQESIINTYHLEKRVQVVNSNILDCEDLLKASDVVVLNNVFQWFVATADQEKIWRFLQSVLRSGTLLVTMPSLETSFSDLKTDISLCEWVEEVDSLKTIDGGDDDEDDDDDMVDLADLVLYRIL